MVKEYKGYKVKYVKKLTDKGFPVHDKHYDYAHRKADEAEKKANPKMYKKSLKGEKKLKKHELMADNYKDKKLISIEKRYKNLSPTLELHEWEENKKLKELDKKKKVKK